MTSASSQFASSASSMVSPSRIAMGQASPTSRHRSVADTTAVGERVCAYLRRRHRSRTVDNVVADLAGWGVKHATIAKMLERQSTPSVPLLFAMVDAYGPDFLAAVHPKQLGWLSEAARAQRKATLEAAMADLKNEMDRL